MDPLMFVSIVILGVTQLIKMAAPTSVHGWLTIIVAVMVGVVAAIFSDALGLADMSIAEGIVAALGAIGISSAFRKSAGNDV